jgi:hypothetical protein
MAAYDPDSVFAKRLRVTWSQTDTKDILLMDGDSPVYGIGIAEVNNAESAGRWSWRELFQNSTDKDVGQVYRYDQSGGKVPLGEVCRYSFGTNMP